MRKGRGCSSSRLGLLITDSCLTQGVPEETPLFLAVKVSLRVALEDITKKKLSFSF